VNKQDLVNEVARRTGIAEADVARFLEAMMDSVRDTVAKGRKVTLSGFGTFERVRRAPRVGRNPRTGVEVRIPATTVPFFHPGKAFREAVGPGRRKRTPRKPARRR
jgi:DNA-binding protein HU-beta